jgi:hypothetical protein
MSNVSPRGRPVNYEKKIKTFAQKKINLELLLLLYYRKYVTLQPSVRKQMKNLFLYG